MRPLLMMLVVTSLGAGAALAQYGTTTTVVPGATSTTVMTTTTAVPVTPVCPSATATLPGLCPAIATQAITVDTIVLVLGTEERYALENLPARRINWRDSLLNYDSIFTPGYPLMSHQPNQVVTRHGNPYFPYYQISTEVNVAGFEERFGQIPSTLSPESRTALTQVTNRYSGLTTQQAIALGYQPVGACMEGLGFVYLNQGLVDNVFDPMVPEVFTFDQTGRVVSAQYILVSPQPVMAFGQQMQPSQLIQGALQLPVWLYANNPNGFFTLQNPNIRCQ